MIPVNVLVRGGGRFWALNKISSCSYCHQHISQRGGGKFWSLYEVKLRIWIGSFGSFPHSLSSTRKMMMMILLRCGATSGLEGTCANALLYTLFGALFNHTLLDDISNGAEKHRFPMVSCGPWRIARHELVEGAGALKFRRRDWVDDGRSQCVCLGKTVEMFKIWSISK